MGLPADEDPVRPQCTQLVPCAKCPWRRDADPLYWAYDQFESMLRTVVGTADEPGFGVMLCHKSTAGQTAAPEERSPLSGTLDHAALCAGYIVVTQFDYIGLRLWSWHTGIDPVALTSAGGLDLYDSFDELIETVRAAHGLS